MVTTELHKIDQCDGNPLFPRIRPQWQEKHDAAVGEYEAIWKDALEIANSLVSQLHPGQK